MSAMQRDRFENTNGIRKKGILLGAPRAQEREIVACVIDGVIDRAEA